MKEKSTDVELPTSFRKLSLTNRRETLFSSAEFSLEEWEAISPDEDILSLADAMVESAVGVMPVPLGVASGFLIDGETVHVPLATEEPSVIAACSFGAKLVRRGGGFETWSDPPIGTGQIFVENVDREAVEVLKSLRSRIIEEIRPQLSSMEKRGGGFRDIDVAFLDETRLARLQIHVDVRDAMGANLLNTMVERLRPVIEEATGGRVLMAILSNDAARRKAGARFRVPVNVFGGNGADVARRIALAADLAREDSSRGVTHNKGIMNGITSLAIATCNDHRAIEAAVHAFAGSDGRYRGLSRFWVEEDFLYGELELPLAFAVVGGGIGYHPGSRAALKILGKPSSTRLARIAASVGLAQNLSALRALVSEGIQQGHMRLHAQRLAFKAGARGDEIAEVAGILWQRDGFHLEDAREILAEVRKPV